MKLLNISSFSETIQYELDRNMEMLSRLLSDISYQSADNLVDGLTKLQEENYNHNKNIRTRSKLFPT